MAVTAYVRDEGVICYAQDLLPTRQLVGRLPQQLLATALDWHWESERGAELAPDSEVQDLPALRLWTRLTAENATGFIKDVLERDVDGYGRFITIVGSDRGTFGLSPDWATLLPPLQQFATREDGPIRIAVFQLNDTPEAFTFVPHEPVDAVRQLLDGWGIIPAAIRMTRPYRWLHGVKLESMLSNVGERIGR